jgi:hypothetical protein
VQVLIFCVMSNHVHVLVHVPKRPERRPDGVEPVWHRERFLRRMWNLGCFMQGVKQGFSQWCKGGSGRATSEVSLSCPLGCPLVLRRGGARAAVSQVARAGVVAEERATVVSSIFATKLDGIEQLCGSTR